MVIYEVLIPLGCFLHMLFTGVWRAGDGPGGVTRQPFML